MLRIFIGYDKSEDDAYNVLCYSIKKYTTIPIHIIKLSTLLTYQLLGYQRFPDPQQSTEFTYLRFLVPALCNYRGKAIFMDCDMLCLSDLKELDDLSMLNCALRAVKHTHVVEENSIKMDGKIQSNYPRKNWSSLMILNCEELRVWTPELVEKASGKRLHRFEDIPDGMIHDIPKGWNTLDGYGSQLELAKLIHFTSGGPWHKGHEFCEGSEAWYRHWYEMQKAKEK